jgi:hypothetical protein
VFEYFDNIKFGARLCFVQRGLMWDARRELCEEPHYTADTPPIGEPIDARCRECWALLCGSAKKAPFFGTLQRVPKNVSSKFLKLGDRSTAESATGSGRNKPSFFDFLFGTVSVDRRSHRSI